MPAENFGIFATMIKTSEFIGSFPSWAKCPKTKKREFAFIGRSNVGKSSLINLLIERKQLAHVSKQPGKTQMLNYILVNDAWYLVDLPGYGYAKQSKKKRRSWQKMVRNYLLESQELICAFVLVDGSIPPQPLDMDFINWLGANGIPCALVFTKVDKLKPVKLKLNLELIREAFLETWEYLPKQFLISSVTKEGREELLEYILDLAEARD